MSIICVLGIVSLYSSVVFSLECDQGWNYFSNTGKCYFVKDEAVPYEENREHCEAMDAEMVTIASADEGNFIQSLSSYHYHWIGLTRVTPDVDKFKWADGTEVKYTNWASGYPSSGYDCAGLYKDLWYSLSCHANQYQLCVKDPKKPVKSKPKCEQGWHYGYGKCYYVKDEYVTFEENREICEAMNGRMAAIHSMDEARAIQYLAPANYHWTSLTRILPDIDKFKWADGSDASFTNWYPGYPSKGYDCTGTTTFQLIGLQCQKKYYQLCEKDAVNPVAVKRPECEAGWRYGYGKCYFVKDEGVTYHQNKINCESMKARMVSVKNMDEDRFIQSLSEYNYHWTSGHRVQQGLDEFKWGEGDGEKLDWSYWYPGHPLKSGDCFTMYYFQFYSADCNAENYQLCEKDGPDGVTGGDEHLKEKDKEDEDSKLWTIEYHVIKK